MFGKYLEWRGLIKKQGVNQILKEEENINIVPVFWGQCVGSLLLHLWALSPSLLYLHNLSFRTSSAVSSGVHPLPPQGPIFSAVPPVPACCWAPGVYFC